MACEKLAATKSAAVMCSCKEPAAKQCLKNKNLEKCAINNMSICSSGTSVGSHDHDETLVRCSTVNIESQTSSTLEAAVKNYYNASSESILKSQDIIDRDKILQGTNMQAHGSHEEDFSSYVQLTLGQIKDDSIIKRAKCQIQLVLTKSLAEHAERELAIIESKKSVSNKPKKSNKKAAI